MPYFLMQPFWVILHINCCAVKCKFLAMVKKREPGIF